MADVNYWHRTSRRFGRRAFLGGAATAGAGLAGAALIGCGGGEDSTSPGGASPAGGTDGGAPAGTSLDDWKNLSAEELLQVASNKWLETLPGQQDALKNGPTTGGTYRITRNAPTSFDALGPGATQMAVHPGTHNSLLTYEWKGDFGPQNEINVVVDLPESLEQQDDLTMVFHLRSEPIYFHDKPPVGGRELTVEDVKFSVEKLKEAPFQGPTYRDVDTVETPDDHTLVLKFSRPAAYFMRTSCIPVQWIIAKEQVDSDEGLGPMPIGTGPFQFVEANRDIGLAYERNPRYFKTDPIYNSGKKLPFLDRIEGTYHPDIATRDAAWFSGQIDHTSTSFATRREIVDLLERRPEVVMAITTPPPSAQPLLVVNSETPPFDDVRVRRAMSMAIDKLGLVEGLVGGLASPGYGQDWNFYDRPQAPAPWTVEELGPYYDYQPDEAKKLLQAAGFESGLGRTIELGWGTSTQGLTNQTYEAMADALRTELGIEIERKMAADAAAYFNNLYGAQYRDLHVGFPLPAWDPDGFTYEQLHSKSTKNFYKVNDPTLDELCERQQVLFNIEERRDVCRQIMERDLDQMYRLWGVNTYKVMMRDPKVFNAADHYLAWMTPGWGELKTELAWKQA